MKWTSVVNPICQDIFRLLFLCGFGPQTQPDFDSWKL